VRATMKTVIAAVAVGNNHLLWAAMTVFMVARTLTLGVAARSVVV